LCTLSFVATLLTTRLEEIAHFAAAGGQGWYILKFAALQIPYILPIVLPISSLISAIVLAQKMSGSQEITTLRASGLSLSTIYSPIFTAAAFLSLFNYYLVSEVATKSVLRSRQLQREIAMVNPLTLLYHDNMVRYPDLLVFTGGKGGQNSAQDITCAIWNGNVNRLSLVKIQNLSYQDPSLVGKNLTMLSTFKPNTPDRYDNLYVENVEQASMDLAGLTLFLKRTTAKVCDDYLSLGLLLSRLDQYRHTETHPSTLPHEKIELQAKLRKGTSEILRRVSVGLAVLSLSVLGLSFGTYTGRSSGYWPIYVVITLAALLVTGIFGAKAFMGNPLIAGAMYFLPQLAIFFLSYFHLKRINEGADG